MNIDRISHAFEIKNRMVSKSSLRIQPNFCSVHDNPSCFKIINIGIFFHHFITLLVGSYDANYEIAKQRFTSDILSPNMKM